MPLIFAPIWRLKTQGGKNSTMERTTAQSSGFESYLTLILLSTRTNILINRLELGQSNIKAIIKNGILTTDIPNINLYGGRGDLDMTVNGNSPVTKFALNFTLKDVDGKGFLGAAAGLHQTHWQYRHNNVISRLWSVAS